MGFPTRNGFGLEVMEENFLGFGKSTFCGDATVPVDALLSGARTLSPGLMQTQPQPVALHKRGATRYHLGSL